MGLSDLSSGPDRETFWGRVDKCKTTCDLGICRSTAICFDIKLGCKISKTSYYSWLVFFRHQLYKWEQFFLLFYYIYLLSRYFTIYIYIYFILVSGFLWFIQKKETVIFNFCLPENGCCCESQPVLVPPIN